MSQTKPAKSRVSGAAWQARHPGKSLSVKTFALGSARLFVPIALVMVNDGTSYQRFLNSRAAGNIAKNYVGIIAMRRTFHLLSVALTLGLLSTGANAAVTIAPPTSFAFDTHAPAAGETLVNDFDGNTNPAFSFFGGTLHTGNAGSQAAKPFGDSTQYEAAEFGNSFIMQGPILKSLSLYIGSLDTYNTITFIGPSFAQAFTGALLGAPANGSTSSPLTNRQFFFTFDASDQIDEVIFSSQKPAFEFDNIFAATAGTVPEPATWVMLILGFGSIGFMLRRQREKSVLTLA
jgi:hypothetical protein